eukprot:TRINITY_DN15117_c1_g1_i1.p1 TRINITY_DN15117_c1_g1~~TRINITY_DN15117_c1_g1_i1.p1  ORF type:complete len:139 (+),score=6.58 TRINITY_DN15117_c1_g1_i1:335-751(+)
MLHTYRSPSKIERDFQVLDQRTYSVKSNTADIAAAKVAKRRGSEFYVAVELQMPKHMLTALKQIEELSHEFSDGLTGTNSLKQLSTTPKPKQQPSLSVLRSVGRSRTPVSTAHCRSRVRSAILHKNVYGLRSSSFYRR